MKTTRSIYALGISAMFLGGFLLLVVFGATTYRNISAVQSSNNELRSSLSYLSTSLTTDRASDLLIRNENVGTVLIIADGDTGYGKRIYLYEGYLVEDYGPVDGSLMPEDAIRIAEGQTFAIRQEEELLIIETDEGTVKVFLQGREVKFS